MKRDFTKQQINALLKIASKDEMRPALTKIAVQGPYLVATDGYKAVLLRTGLPDDTVTTMIDKTAIKGYWAINPKANTISIDTLQSLAEPTAEYSYPDLRPLLPKGDYNHDQRMIPPKQLAEVATCLAYSEAPLDSTVDITFRGNANMALLTNADGDIGLVMATNAEMTRN